MDLADAERQVREGNAEIAEAVERESVGKITGLADGLIRGWGFPSAFILAHALLTKLASLRLDGTAPPALQRIVRLARAGAEAMDSESGADIALAGPNARVNGRRIVGA